jgi:hypothetical protein
MAAQIAAALRANTDALYADKITFVEFRAENARLWRQAEADLVVHDQVCALLRDQEAA